MGKLQIASYGGERFKDRLEAGGLLAAELKRNIDNNSVVMGIPRGGVIIAKEIAGVLRIDFDIVLSRKLGHPTNPEYAIGSVTEDGRLFLHKGMTAGGAEEARIIEDIKKREVAEINRRISLYRGVKPKVDIKGKNVIITDDGLATGATMRAAIWSARHEGAARIMAAVPVSPEDTAKMIADEADLTLILRIPPAFFAVGQFYKNFDQVSDQEVIKILKSG